MAWDRWQGCDGPPLQHVHPLFPLTHDTTPERRAPSTKSHLRCTGSSCRLQDPPNGRWDTASPCCSSTRRHRRSPRCSCHRRSHRHRRTVPRGTPCTTRRLYRRRRTRSPLDKACTPPHPRRCTALHRTGQWSAVSCQQHSRIPLCRPCSRQRRRHCMTQTGMVRPCCWSILADSSIPRCSCCRTATLWR